MALVSSVLRKSSACVISKRFMNHQFSASTLSTLSVFNRYHYQCTWSQWIFIGCGSLASFMSFKFYNGKANAEQIDTKSESMQTSNEIDEPETRRAYISANIGLYLDQHEYSRAALPFYKYYIKHGKSLENVNIAIINVAATYFDLKDYVNALKMFEKLDETHIFEKNLENFIAECYNFGPNDLPSSIKYYEQYLSNPQSDRQKFDAIYVILALSYGELGKFEESLEMFSMLDEDYIIAHKLEMGIGNTYFYLGQYNDAIKWYNEFLSNMKNTNEMEMFGELIMANLGAAYFQMNHFLKSSVMFQNCSDEIIIKSLEICGYKHEAVNVWVRYLKNPNFPQSKKAWARYLAAGICIKSEQYQEALKVLSYNF